MKRLLWILPAAALLAAIGIFGWAENDDRGGESNPLQYEKKLSFPDERIRYEYEIRTKSGRRWWRRRWWWWRWRRVNRG